MLRLDAGRAALVDKVKSVVPGSHVRSRLLASSVAPGRVTHAPFSSAKRAAVRASAADDGGSKTFYAPNYDPNERRKPREPRARKVEKTITVQLEDLKPGMELDGTVIKVETFGAFVDVGAKFDGLVHVSQLQDGFVKNANDHVQVGQSVRVKVIAFDAAKERLGLTMKGLTGSRAVGGVDDDADEVDEEEAEEEAEAAAGSGDDSLEGPLDLNDDDEDEGEEEAEDDTPEISAFDIPDGTDIVFPEELPESFFLVPEYAENADDLTPEGLADYETNDEQYAYEFQHQDDGVPLPLYELVKGTVSRVEPYGAFVAFAGPGGKQMEGMLHVSEMKAPASILSEEELEVYDPEEQEEEGETVGLYEDYAHNEYVDVGEIADANQIYKVGDEITCFYIGISDVDEFGRGGGINLSQFTDAELLGASVEVSTPDEEEDVLDDGEFEVDDELAEDFDDDGLMAVDPVRLLEEDNEAEPTAAEMAALISGSDASGRRGGRFGDEEEEEEGPIDEDMIAGDAETHQKGNMLVANSMLLKDGRVFLGQIPSRPMRRSDASEMPDLSSLARQEEDFELDVSDLQDYWTDVLTAEIPKHAMRKAGYKLQISEDGTVEEVRRTLADGKVVEVPDEVFNDFSLAGDLNERARAFLDDLMDEEDEAELPAYALRRPHV